MKEMEKTINMLLEAISKMVNCIIQLIFAGSKDKKIRDGFLLKMNGPSESHDSGLKEASKVHFECKQFADVIIKTMRGFENEGFIAFLRPLLKNILFLAWFVIPFTLNFVFVSKAKADILENIKSLGGNDVLYEKAKILTPEKNIQIVQTRLVDRFARNELNFEMDVVVGGDVFLHTSLFGLNYQFHLTPYWSFGLKGYMGFNQLSNEGDEFVNYALDLRNNFQAFRPLVPDIDYVRYASYLVVNWYPIYGKLSLYEVGIGHYDIYLLSGVGRVWLRRGGAIGFLGGGGLAFWLSDHIAFRVEFKYETYNARRLSTNPKQRLHLATISFALGYIL